VKAYPGEMMVTNGPGTDKAGPWIIERAMRDAKAAIAESERDLKDKVLTLPERFSFHDLRHYLASPADCIRGRHQDSAGTDEARDRPDDVGHVQPPVARRRRVHPLGSWCCHCQADGLV
jgi:hypothetical protein